MFVTDLSKTEVDKLGSILTVPVLLTFAEINNEAVFDLKTAKLLFSISFKRFTV